MSIPFAPIKTGRWEIRPETRCFGSNSREEERRQDSFTDDLIQALDLAPLIHHLADHTGTKRGRDSLLALLGENQEFNHKTKQLSSNRRRAILEGISSQADFLNVDTLSTKDDLARLHSKISKSPRESREEYERVEQATLVLSQMHNLTLPPLYGADAHPSDVKSLALYSNDDNDAWLFHSSQSDFSLEDIVQAEQVTTMLLRVYEWSLEEDVRTWTPFLSDIGNKISDIAASLQSTLEKIQHTVEISRVRSITDPGGRSSFHFRLNETTFPALGLLRKKEVDLQQRSQLDSSSKIRRELSNLQEDIIAKENEIELDLSLTILSSRKNVNKALNIVAELDILFSKAAFGQRIHGRNPTIGVDGQISIHNFVHPLLALKGDTTNVVPIDLNLFIEQEKRALLISGMNGGGKTVGLKSFGMAALLCKLGIPIPCSKTPRVDFFENILTSVGDGQDLNKGESTFMAQLNAYSRIIHQLEVTEDAKNPTLVLLDELGGGTEATAGGAIGQAILEKILDDSSSRIVVTTHSSALKTLSFESPMFECASVLRTGVNGNDSYGRPTFSLQYGVIGESYAMGAAAQCRPALPKSVLERASHLIKVQEEDAANTTAITYTEALTQSLEKLVASTEEANTQALEYASNMARLQRAMMSLAQSHEQQLGRLEDRVEEYYQQVRAQPMQPIEILGETLRELRVVKKQIQQQAERLKEQGLKLLPDGHELAPGDVVVIIDDGGAWDGVSASVVEAPKAAKDDVWVLPSGFGVEAGAMAFTRYQLAIWDYESVWEEDADDLVVASTSVPASRRRLNDVLASLGTGTKGSSPLDKPNGDSQGPQFTSSRQRKAAKASTKRNKKGRKK